MTTGNRNLLPATPMVMVIHNHQPVGNFSWVTADCYETAYAPFLEILERHPEVRVGLHFTGPLLEWLAAERPVYLERIRALVAAGQVEVLGGGFYEPILPVIPERDRLGQLLLLRDSVRETFGQFPSGAWLAERVWEPQLPTVLVAAGVRYVLIDDDVFHRLGYSACDTRAVFLTEDQGAALYLLPISDRLRYSLPTKPVSEIIATLHEMREEGAEVLIYAEDGERYGNWPGTAHYLYGDEAYLDRLFSALEEDPAIEMVLPSALLTRTEPAKRVYVPPTSYREMLCWSGGFWRNFLTRYRESNLMHKKMYQVSQWCAQAKAAGSAVSDAQRHLYAAQCNCAYWYGAFGGLYLPHLRRAVYHHLLCAEHLLLPALMEEQRPNCAIADHDLDGCDEVFLRSGALSVGIAPAQGGGVFALEHLDLAHNFLDTMGRYPLRNVDDDIVLRDELPEDWYPRLACLDHILSDAVPVDDLAAGHYGERGDFILGSYAILSSTKQSVCLQREGHFWDGPDFVRLTIEKEYTAVDSGVRVSYRIHNPTNKARSFRFGSEINACVSACTPPERTLELLGAIVQHGELTMHEKVPDLHGVTYQDSWLGGAFTVSWSLPAATYIYPLYTPLRSLSGVEWVYQSTIVLPTWQLQLAPKASWVLTLNFAVLATAQDATT